MASSEQVSLQDSLEEICHRVHLNRERALLKLKQYVKVMPISFSCFCLWNTSPGHVAIEPVAEKELLLK